MKRWIVPVTTISMTIGMLVSVQYKSQVATRQMSPSRRVEDLAFMLKNTEQSNKQIADQVASLQDRLGKIQTGGGPATEAQQAIYPAVAGPGLQVTIAESKSTDKSEDGASAVVHAEDLLKIINELRSGGAEAIALNGHRITEISEVITAGQHVVVNKTPIVAPYEIVAIGPAEDMKNTLGLRGGVVEYLQFYGIGVKAKAKKHLDVPSAGDLREFRFAHPTMATTAGATNSLP